MGISHGFRPDAISGSGVYLIKNVSTLRLTSQIRTLTRMAGDHRQSLMVIVPRTCQLSEDLTDFVRANRSIEVDRSLEP